MPDRLGLDPRTTLITVAVTSIVVLAPGGSRFVAGGVALGVALALASRAWGRAVGLVAAAAVLAVLAHLLPTVAGGPLVTLVALASAYGLRFTVVAGVAMHLVATVPPARLSAALRAWRLPRALSVTSSVMLRFFPVVAAETRAVVDGMRLRGLAGPAGVLRHPVLAVERFTVPVIASTLRVGEDLSASAILRGLGSPHRPTSVDTPRLTWRDGAFVAVIAAVATLSALTFPGAP